MWYNERIRSNRSRFVDRKVEEVAIEVNKRNVRLEADRLFRWSMYPVAIWGHSPLSWPWRVMSEKTIGAFLVFVAMVAMYALGMIFISPWALPVLLAVNTWGLALYAMESRSDVGWPFAEAARRVCREGRRSMDELLDIVSIVTVDRLIKERNPLAAPYLFKLSREEIHEVLLESVRSLEFESLSVATIKQIDGEADAVNKMSDDVFDEVARRAFGLNS